MNINNIFKELVNDIYISGFEYEDPNRKGVIRKQIPFYDFKWEFKNGFPSLGLKQSFPKLAFQEMLCFMKGINNLKELKKEGINFWDKDGYNYYKRKTKKEVVSFEEFLEKNPGDLGKIYPFQIRNWNSSLDQLNLILNRLKENKHTTKNIVSMWNPSDMQDMALSPCHWSFELIVEPKGLWIKWNQASTDVFLGLPMNIMYYSYLCIILAHYLDMQPLGIIGNLTNLHLYDNSFKAVEELLKRNPYELSKVEVENNLPQSWSNLDDYLNQLNYTQVKVKNYKHLGKLNVEMLPYG